MSWMTDIADPTAARERALKGLTVPLGLANPLWLAFGAAASAGAAWWLMTRWTRPFNVETLFAGAAPAKTPPTASKKAVELVVEKTPETTPVLLEVALDVAPAIVEASAAPLEAALEGAHEAVEAYSAVVEDTLAEVEEEDDLTRMVGVGPRTARALIDRGVTRFAHLAAWTTEEMAAFDAELKLKGRSARDAWLAQAKRLATEA